MCHSISHHQRKSNMKNVCFWPSHVITLRLIVFFNMISISEHSQVSKDRGFFNLPNVKQGHLPCGTKFYQEFLRKERLNLLPRSIQPYNCFSMQEFFLLLKFLLARLWSYTN